MVMMILVKRIFPINQTPYISKLLYVTRDRNGTLLVEPVLFFSFFQQLHEQRMIEVNDRHHESLLLLSFGPDLDG